MKKQLLFVLLIFFIDATISKLVQVQVITRHCDRTPVNIKFQMPNNPIDWRKIFNLEAGQLTPLGMSQCRSLGEKLRRRYVSRESENRITDISSNYHANDYIFHSSQYERTIISMNSISSGLFPNGQLNLTKTITVRVGNEQRNVTVLQSYQPIPVNVVNKEDDGFFSQYDKCGMSEKRKLVTNTAEWTKYEEENKEFLKRISDISGVKGLTVENLATFGDNVNVQYFHNLLLPELKENFKKIEKIFEKTLWSYFARDTWGKIGSGPLAGLFLDGMRNYISKKSSQKYIHYSAHDSSISMLISALRLDKEYPDIDTVPAYGAALAFELHEDENHNHFVKVVYSKGYETKDFQTLILKPYKCENEKCEFSQFQREITADLIPSWEEWCYECSNRELKQCLNVKLKDKGVETIVLSTTIVTSLLFNIAAIFIILSLCICKGCLIKSKSQQQEYSSWTNLNQ
eukprot:gene7635-11957_t